MKGITIRKATINDLGAIQELNHELCIKEHNEYDSTINPDYPLSKAGEEYFKSKIESSDSLALVAETKGNIVGYFVGSLADSPDYRVVRLAEAENMYVKESFRSQGIGSGLSLKFEDWCRERKVERIRHIASAGNVEAIKFYKKHGCKEVDIALEKDL